MPLCALIKSNLDPQLNEYPIIWSTRCYPNNSLLHITLLNCHMFISFCFNSCAVSMGNQYLSRNLLIVLLVMCICVHFTGGWGLIRYQNSLSIMIFSSLYSLREYLMLPCRPFGCGVILGGYDRDGPQLYMVEPSGVSYVSLFWSFVAISLAINPLAFASSLSVTLD